MYDVILLSLAENGSGAGGCGGDCGACGVPDNSDAAAGHIAAGAAGGRLTPVSVVKINAITVPKDSGDELAKRFEGLTVSADPVPAPPGTTSASAAPCWG